ncbi:MAG: transcription antitermination factor NusB [Raineya sp.]
MLNRRLLRIKAMQAIYAYYQAQYSQYEIAQDFIQRAFEPDLNSMQKQDKKRLQEEAQIALEIFEKSYETKEIQAHSKANPKINHSVVQAIEYYYKALEKEQKRCYTEMLAEAEGIYENYLQILLFGIELSRLVAQQRDKKSVNPDAVKIRSEYKLAENRIFEIIAQSPYFQEQLTRKSVSWEKDRELVLLFLQNLKKDKEYSKYVALGEANLEDDYFIADYIFREFLFRKVEEDKPEEQNELQAYFEAKDLNWSENREILKSLVLKTLKKAKESPQNFELLSLSQDWQADKEFFETLFQKTIAQAPTYDKLLAEKAQNWRTERFVMMDKIILEMAITEMISFPSIPVKVSINEYIELAKNYSTPKSKTFVNGLLNTLAETLKIQGAIKKSGRGLLDNK